ncbi:MAG: DUF4422 domain-containing protein, partial [Enterococcus sp.]
MEVNVDEDIKMLVVTHKEAPMPSDTALYIPMLVGPNKNQLQFHHAYRDDEGVNIAEKNPNYCELTAMYWAWKNLDAKYVGITHYRRLFMDLKDKHLPVQEETLAKLFEEVDVILPKKRNYYIENTWSHYKHNHNIADLKMTKEIIAEKYPSYIPFFEETMTHT